MVYCPKCGSDNPNDNKFCINCGTSLRKNDSTNQQYNTNQSTETTDNQQKTGNKNKQICILIIIVAILFVIIGAFVGNSTPINLEEIKSPTGYYNGSHNKTAVSFFNYDTESISVMYNDKDEDVSRLPLAIEDRGARIIFEDKYEIQNYEVNEIVYYSSYYNSYYNMYFIKFNDKWYTILYLTDHINKDVINTYNPVNQVITSMINQYNS